MMNSQPLPHLEHRVEAGQRAAIQRAVREQNLDVSEGEADGDGRGMLFYEQHPKTAGQGWGHVTGQRQARRELLQCLLAFHAVGIEHGILHFMKKS